MSALIGLADRAGVEARRTAMVSGQKINETEGRAVLHTALRAPRDAEIIVDGRNVVSDVHDTLDRMAIFAEEVRTGKLTGSTGKAITDVVNIGIGGSDLGPAMVVRALRPFCDGPRCHYVSNVDGAHLHDTLIDLDPETTMFLVASKTFTTQETMANANTARQWILDEPELSVKDHFVAMSTNLAAVSDFGIAHDRVFGFWDWVGGRYSLWSAIGLSIMIAIGSEQFRALLAGGHAMDKHFQNAPLDRNMPVILALLGIWYRNFLDYRSHAVIPYDQRLCRFPVFLQQLDMESNGKQVRLDGNASSDMTAPIVWGEPGTNGQHAFFQLLHQGTDVVPVDFLLAANPQEKADEQHLMLAANCFAQAEALMQGRNEAEVRTDLEEANLSGEDIEKRLPHKTFPGDRPSNMLLYDQLDPQTLGSLIALYEHKIFVQGVIWGINSFDQWGVELGKVLAQSILPDLQSQKIDTLRDPSTSGLIARFKALRRPITD